MFNKKSFLLGAAALLLASGLAGCGGGGTDKGDLLYWCPNMDNNVMDEIVEEFKKDNPDYADKNFKRQNYGEGDTYKNLHKSWKDAADVMLMADDNIRMGVEAEEILVIDEEKDYVREHDGEKGLDAASVDGHLAGFPYRGDNCPLPHINLGLFNGANDPRLATFEGMLAACKEANMKLYFNVTDGWYGASVLATAGVTFKAGKSAEDGSTVLLTDVVDKSADAGDVLQTLKDLYNEYDDTWVVSASQGDIEAGFGNNTIGVAWLHNDLAGINANSQNDVTVCAWPKLGNRDMKSIAGYKVVVLKDQGEGERLDLAKAFAKYIAGEKAQKMRMEALGYGPSNLNLMDSDEAAALPFVKVVGEMSKAGRLVPQGSSTTGDFWTPLADLNGLIVNGEEGWGDYPDAAAAAVALVTRDGWEAM